MKHTAMYTVRLELDEDERRALKVLAARRDQTISQVVTSVVRAELGKADTPVAPERRMNP